MRKSPLGEATMPITFKLPLGYGVKRVLLEKQRMDVWITTLVPFSYEDVAKLGMMCLTQAFEELRDMRAKGPNPVSELRVFVQLVEVDRATMTNRARHTEVVKMVVRRRSERSEPYARGEIEFDASRVAPPEPSALEAGRTFPARQKLGRVKRRSYGFIEIDGPGSIIWPVKPID